jgi:hypothetical protein
MTTRRHSTFASIATALALLVAVSVTVSPASGVAGFGDVGETAFYANGVQWMADNNITTGTSPTCFSPSDPVTRGQAAAFMWRMEGEPSAPVHSFTDVTAGYQQVPVSWMAHNQITTGTTPTTYAPDAQLTRGQLAALLHRLAGSPTASGHPFGDIPTSWQQTPVAWMVANGITTGTSPVTFSPNANVTRGELATFFWRYKDSPPVTIDPTHPTTPACLQQVSGPTTTTTTATTTTTVPPSPVVYSGSGDDVISIPAGSQQSTAPWAANFTHDGAENFIVELSDSGGGLIDIPVNHIGNYAGLRPYGFDLFGPSEPVRFIEVRADGSWTITLNPLSSLPSLSSSPGASYGSAGDSVVRFSNGGSPSVVRFDCSDCDANIILWSYGDNPDLLENDIGDGSPFANTFLVPAGTDYIEVRTSASVFGGSSWNFVPGEWSLSVS